ncbi:hypothetical protein F4X86_01970 [Candidatus Saccharibacteria bacterium]|nr:hypothetical protein [Candidatus Saccharibacteria bacterium]
MDDNPRSSKNHLIIFATTALAMVALIVLIIVISRNGEEQPEPETQDQTNQEAGENEEVDQEPGEEEEGGGDEAPERREEEAADDGSSEEESAESEEEEPPVQPTGQLPDNWRELSSAEKTALNPFDCPEDENGIVHLSAETGECLDVATADEDDDQDDSQDSSRIDVPEDAVRVDFGEAFPYSNDLELAVTGLSCHNLTIVSIDTSYPTDQTLTLGQVLEDYADDWELYKTDPEGWAKFHFEINYDAADNPVYYTGFLPYLEENYKYLLNFENWLQTNGISSEDLSEQLFNYLDCRILVSLTNTGPTMQLPSSCPAWEFRTTMELIGEKRDYGQSDRVLLQPPLADCSDDPIDFLTGEVVESGFTPFIVNSDDEIREIIVRDGAETFRIVRD